MVAGSSEAIKTAAPMIESLTRSPGGMSVVGNKVGMASDFKLINQVYCAIQICVTGSVIKTSLSIVLIQEKVWHLPKLWD